MALTFDHLHNDTIAAIATAMAESGIGIIRVSGPEAAAVGSLLYRTGKRQKTDISAWNPGTIRFGYIVEEKDGSEEIIDEVMLSYFRAPHSYTTEDTVEINTHGGMFVMNRVLQMVLKAGCRLAEPGEFTKRAFLGGRIDLARAEAVMDMISSQNEFSRKNAAAQMSGAVSERIRSIREKILYQIAFIESALDDPENYTLEGYPESLMTLCHVLEEEMRSILKYTSEGRILQEGIRTVIVGRPNVGKSSLLNFLTGEERAIVTEVAGTTRDTLSESVRVGGVSLYLTDTAGIRNTQDQVEQIGVMRARKAMQSAELILFVIDSSRPLDREDAEIAHQIRSRMNEGAKCIIIFNKTDLTGSVSREALGQWCEEVFGLEADTSEVDGIISAPAPGTDEARKDVQLPSVIACSMKTGEGHAQLGEMVAALFHTGEIAQNNELFLMNHRHRESMQEALDAICLVEESIENGMSEEFYSVDLMNAYRALGMILGEAVEDDLVEEIFSRFCLGK